MKAKSLRGAFSVSKVRHSEYQIYRYPLNSDNPMVMPYTYTAKEIKEIKVAYRETNNHSWNGFWKKF